MRLLQFFESITEAVNLGEIEDMRMAMYYTSLAGDEVKKAMAKETEYVDPFLLDFTGDYNISLEDLDDEQRAEFDEWLETAIYDQTADALNRVMQDMKTNDEYGGVVLYRYIVAPPNLPETFHTKPVGIYWSSNPNEAKAHWSQEEEGSVEWLITAVTPADNINWVATIYQNTIEPHEAEIQVRQGSQVTIIDLKPQSSPESAYGTEGMPNQGNVKYNYWADREEPLQLDASIGEARTKKLTAWELMAHYDVVDEAQAAHDLMLPWVNNNRPGNISKMARDPKFRLAGQIRYYFEFIIGVRDMSKPATTVEHFEAALNQPIPLWRGGGGEYDAEFRNPRAWVSFTADERRVKAFSHYDGTHGGSTPGTRLQVRSDSWEIKLDLPLKDILLYLEGGGDSEVIVSKKDAKRAQMESRLTESLLMELQDIGDPSKMTSQELVDQLYENGWEEIGEESSFSDVYGKSSSPWVVKVLRSAQPAHNNDFMCAMQWYRYCLNNWQSNPHVPRIPFVKTLRESGKLGVQGYHTYVVMIERLDEFDGFEFEWSRDDPFENAVMWSVMGEFVGFTSNWASEEQTTEAVVTILRMMPEHLVRRYYAGEPRHHAYISQNEFGSDVWYETLAEAIVGSGSPMTLSLLSFDGTMLAAAKGHILAQTLKAVNDLSRKSGCDLDLHTGNIMVRPSTGELVVTDPVQG